MLVYIKFLMALLERIVFYLVLALGIIIFLKLDSKISLVNRLLAAIVVTLILLLLFLFISAIVSIVLVIVVVVLLISFLEKKQIKFGKIWKK